MRTRPTTTARLTMDNSHKGRAIHFLELASSGDVDEAYERFALPTGRHHSPYFGVATLHLFRFEDGKVVELWDFGQPIQADSPNSDGPF
jgi:hypothetical protein